MTTEFNKLVERVATTYNTELGKIINAAMQEPWIIHKLTFELRYDANERDPVDGAPVATLVTYVLADELGHVVTHSPTVGTTVYDETQIALNMAKALRDGSNYETPSMS